VTSPPRDERPTVLVVDDEESFTEALGRGLDREGFRVLVAVDGPSAIELLAEHEPDVVLLDLMLPGISGIDVCRTIRERSDVPVIVVSAKSSEVDTVVSLEVGADDYIAKPYRLQELVARIRAVLRRRARNQQSRDDTTVSPTREGPLVGGPVELDVEQHRCFIRGEEVMLPPKEFRLLQVLLDNQGRVLERHVLLERVWGFDYEGDPRTLDVHVKRLRSKIEDDPARPLFITTVRGIGYRFERSPEAD
jgi:two-component system response regulator RegX3